MYLGQNPIFLATVDRVKSIAHLLLLWMKFISPHW